MAMEHIVQMLEAAARGASRFPPTELYNEGWLGRLVMHWFSSHVVAGHPLNFAPQATWYSEALLPSAFRPRHRGDLLAEARTHADGAIGHFRIGAVGKADLSLVPTASQFIVVEAKLRAPLAAGVGKARSFDQAARNVACLVETLCRANRPAETMQHLRFCVLAPQAKIDSGDFAQLMQRESIKAKVAARVGAYGGEKDQWFQEWFEPSLSHIDLEALSWEQLIATITRLDARFGEDLFDFYQNALRFCGLSSTDR